MKKIGRPKSDTPKSRLLSLRMTVEDYKKLQEYATEHHMTITRALLKGVELLYETP